MVECVEKRFGAFRAPYRVQWLSDNGSIFAAHKTIEIALALNLEPCFTPVESPESNGTAEAFVKTFKARLCPHNCAAGCRHHARPNRKLDGRLQDRSPALAIGLPFPPRVHRYT